MKRIKYINAYWGQKYNRETIDEFSTYKEAREMLKEYKASDPTGTYYISQRACLDW